MTKQQLASKIKSLETWFFYNTGNEIDIYWWVEGEMNYMKPALMPSIDELKDNRN